MSIDKNGKPDTDVDGLDNIPTPSEAASAVESVKEAEQVIEAKDDLEAGSPSNGNSSESGNDDVKFNNAEAINKAVRAIDGKASSLSINPIAASYLATFKTSLSNGDRTELRGRISSLWAKNITTLKERNKDYLSMMGANASDFVQMLAKQTGTICVIARSGGGKTTFMRALSRIAAEVRPTKYMNVSESDALYDTPDRVEEIANVMLDPFSLLQVDVPDKAAASNERNNITFVDSLKNLFFLEAQDASTATGGFSNGIFEFFELLEYTTKINAQCYMTAFNPLNLKPEVFESLKTGLRGVCQGVIDLHSISFSKDRSNFTISGSVFLRGFNNRIETSFKLSGDRDLITVPEITFGGSINNTEDVNNVTRSEEELAEYLGKVGR